MFNREIGISVYPDKQSQQSVEQYLCLARKYGFSKLFVSFLHLKKEIFDQQLIIYKSVLLYASKLGFYITADIGEETLKMLKIDLTDIKVFKEMQINCLRLDVPLLAKQIADCTFNEYGLDCELNLSNNDHLIDNILDYNPLIYRLKACHNFYPQPLTGLDENYFVLATNKYRKYCLRTCAFVASHYGEVGPTLKSKQLPTLEIHRNLPISTQAKHLWAIGLIDDVVIGNAFATEEELQQLAKVNRNILEFRIQFQSGLTEMEFTIIRDFIHFRRGDINTNFIRSTMPRSILKNIDIPVRNIKTNIKKGDIVIVNNNDLHYKAELQIALVDNPFADNIKINVIGKIIDQEIFLLDYIESWTRFKLI